MKNITPIFGFTLMKHRSEIDGLRALAVIPVILYHAGFSFFSGGFIGVDVFFVISGYLITNIILIKTLDGNFSLFEFYERRARRILPALFAMIFFCVPFVCTIMPLDEIESFFKSLVAVPIFLSNVFFWRDVSYFDNAGDYKPLLHTWSLAVEEQYYLVFPIFLILICRLGRKWLFISICVFILLSLGCAQWASQHYPTAAFYLLPSRGWELLIGAAGAVISIKFKNKIKTTSFSGVTAWCGVVLILYSIIAYNKKTPVPSFYTITPTIGSILILVFAHKDTGLGRLLSNKILVGIGILSYSLYLWHQPALVFARYLKHDLVIADKALVLFLVLVMSYISWRFVEQPFRGKQVIKRLSVFYIATGFSSLLVLGGCIGSFIASKIQPENHMAKQLNDSPSIYFGNSNRRRFLKSLINITSKKPDLVIIGSSRMMNIGDHNTKKNALNLSVTGASVEDIIAISGLSLNKFKPQWLLIGCDPWIFNNKAGDKADQILRLGLETEYLNAVDWIDGKGDFALRKQIDSLEASNFFTELFFKINIFKYEQKDNNISFFLKKRHDGSILVDYSSATKSAADVEIGIKKHMYFGMREFEFSAEKQEVFEKLVKKVATSDISVALVLSPYHPKLYKLIQNSDQNVIKMENTIRNISRKLGVNVVGSYNPLDCGCGEDEFFDGSHPKDSCMEKIVEPFFRN